MTTKIFTSMLFLAVLISTLNCAFSNRTEATNTKPSTATIESSDNAETSTAAGGNVGGNADETAPDAVVKDLYKTHGADSGAILDGKSRKTIDKYFDKTLADYIWKDLTTQRDEVGVLDFDPFYNAQDVEIKNLKVGEPKVDGDRASVSVTFQNYDRKENLTYSLARQNGAWKISDIRYSDGSTLVGYFKEYERNNPTKAGDSSKTEEKFFEGIYRVGETTCTVKPIKMAFEIKWAKGSGTMIFFFEGDASQGKYVYASESKSKGSDRFIFDDDTFTTGKFIRGSDGREMPVSKVK